MSRPASESACFKASVLRLPPDLWDYLREEAAARGRPINTHIYWILDYFREHPVELTPPRKQRALAATTPA